MNQATHTFVDRLTNITVTGNLVRLEFGVLQPVAGGGEQQAQLVATQTLVIPLEGFLPSFGMMDSMLKKLTEAGVLKLRPAQEQGNVIQ